MTSLDGRQQRTCRMSKSAMRTCRHRVSRAQTRIETIALMTDPLDADWTDTIKFLAYKQEDTRVRESP